MPILNNWSVVNKWRGPISVENKPDDWRLRGVVSGHPYHEDGNIVTTGPIEGITADGKVKTRHSEYELLDPDPGYEQLFPNAKQKLIDSLRTNHV